MKIYDYGALGLRACDTIAHNDSRYIVKPNGISGELIRRADLDISRDSGGSGYYTTKRKAVEAFIARGESRLKAKIAPEDKDDWRRVIAEARKVLVKLA